MAWYNFASKVKETPKIQQFGFTVKHEEYSGEVVQKKFQGFSQDVGEDHPFNPKITEGLYQRFGLVNGVVDKYVDFIWGGGFYVTCNEPGGDKAVTVINNWLKETQFSSVGRQWIKEALLKPGGYLELNGKKNQPITSAKVLDGKYMYVRRDKLGNVLGYTQYVGGFDQFQRNKAIKFEPFQIAALHFNTIGDCAYGLGIVQPNVAKIDQLIGLDRDVHTIIKRKANNPLHIKIGSSDPSAPFIPDAGTIDAARNDLQTLTAKTEWVTDPYWDIKSIDTGDIGGKFDATINHDVDMLIFGFQVPEVLLGRGSIPEGLAGVQADAFERRVGSFQEEIEKVMETQIFNRVLQAAGLVMKVEVEWGQPSAKETNDRIAQIQGILSIMNLSPDLREMLEMELAKLLGLDVEELKDAQEERELEAEEPLPLVPGQNQTENEKHTSRTTVRSTPTVRGEGSVASVLETSSPITSPPTSDTPNPYREEATLTEWLGFNYQDYIDNIIKAVQKDSFANLAAVTEEEIMRGKFTSDQIIALKKILAEAYKTGASMNKVARAIKEEVQPIDLVYTNKAGTDVTVAADTRPMMIARSETTRLASLGTAEYYKDNGMEEYRWMASSIGSCDICSELNGQVFSLKEMPMLPGDDVHPNCRCAITAVTPYDKPLQ